MIRETNKGKPVTGVKDGIGYVTGYEKGSKDLGEAGGIQFEIVPCDMSDKTVGLEFFDHYQDFDYDGLTSISEWFWSNYTFFHDGKEMRYGNLSSSEWDSDGDMLSDGWEIRYGFDPCSDNSPNKNDDDGDRDGIKDVNEFYLGNPEEKVLERIWKADKKTFRKNIVCRVHDMSLWGAQPDRQDIFVEVDWMKNNLTGKEYKMSNGAKEKAILAFYKACKHGINITLHIDDFCMGGGTNISSIDPNPNTDPFNPYYNPYPSFFIAKDGLHYLYENSFSNSRKNIFHYCVIVQYGIHNGKKCDGDGSSLIGEYMKKGFVIYESRRHDPNVIQNSMGKIFMHELGHNIGLDWLDFHGIDRDILNANQYPSVMNYNVHDVIGSGYSDGSRETDGNPSDQEGTDHNDWEDIELNLFNTWKV